MIILDTNVLSELIRTKPNQAVEAWARTQGPSAIFTTTICEAELLYGVALLPAGQRRENLARAVEAMLNVVLAGRVLPFDRGAATEYARSAAARRALGHKIDIADLEIAAIGRARGAKALATRNIHDFVGCELTLIDPWDGP